MLLVLDWDLNGDGGSITNDGLFTASTLAGTFKEMVMASIQTAEGKLTATASVEVEPGPLSRVVAEPSAVTLDIGAIQPFNFKVYDSFDNETSKFIAKWSVHGELGTIDDSGALTVGSTAGLFLGDVHIEAIEGTSRISASADVIIRPDPLASVVIRPAFIVDQDVHTAVGLDRYGNLIPELEFIWDAIGGDINENGFFKSDWVGPYELRATLRLGVVADPDYPVRSSFTMASGSPCL